MRVMNKILIDGIEVKPFIRMDVITNRRDAGFLNPTTGIFTVDREIVSEKDIDDFLDKYNLPAVMIVKANIDI